MELVHGDLVVGADRDDLLREDVERVARDRRLLDRALAHRLRDDGALEQVGAELREDAALRDGAELVARAPDALQPTRHRLRALDLDDEIDGAHVDPELEARRRDEARDATRLQVLLDQDALLARERAVMRARDLLELIGDAAFGVRLGQLVDPEREPLGEPPVVDEDDRRAVGADELEQGGVDRRPDRADVRLVARSPSPPRPARPAATAGCDAFQLAHVLDRDHDLEIELLALSGVDERDLAARAGDEAPDLVERPLRGREPDPLERPLDDPLESLERDREMRAALRAGDRVHLVEDQRLDARAASRAPAR